MTKTQRVNRMTSTALSLCLAGCLQAEVVPLVDAGSNTTPDSGTADAGDPSVHWPVVAHDFGREMGRIYSCDSALLWSFYATRDSLGNQRNDEEVWAWEVGGNPQVLAANLRPVGDRLAGCHEGFAYWTETDGEVSSLHRRTTSASGAAELVHVGERWSTWTMGDEGRVTRRLDDESGIEVLDVDDSSVTVFSFVEFHLNELGSGERASGDHLYVSGQGSRIAFTPGAEWSLVQGSHWDAEFAPVAGRLVGTEWGVVNTLVWQRAEDGTQLILAEACRSMPVVSAREGWVLWNFASPGGTGCSSIGRSAVDGNGNVHSQPFPELSQWAEEMAVAANDPLVPRIRVLQFGAQIAFFDMVRGTIRLTDEPPFPCVDPSLPCPEGAVCAPTLCAHLPD